MRIDPPRPSQEWDVLESKGDSFQSLGFILSTCRRPLLLFTICVTDPVLFSGQTTIKCLTSGRVEECLLFKITIRMATEAQEMRNADVIDPCYVQHLDCRTDYRRVVKANNIRLDGK